METLRFILYAVNFSILYQCGKQAVKKKQIILAAFYVAWTILLFVGLCLPIILK